MKERRIKKIEMHKGDQYIEEEIENMVQEDVIIKKS